MSDVTHILARMDAGDPAAAEQLLPLVYQELRTLASAKLAQEQPGQTLQPTALVHEAYLRLVAREVPQTWENRGHFFASAAEAMRRILIENARRKHQLKRGGGRQQELFRPEEISVAEPSEELIALDEALNILGIEDPMAAKVVQLRYFGGLTIPQTAAVLGISPRKTDFLWAFARAWLRRKIEGV